MIFRETYQRGCVLVRAFTRISQGYRGVGRSLQPVVTRAAAPLAGQELQASKPTTLLPHFCFSTSTTNLRCGVKRAITRLSRGHESALFSVAAASHPHCLSACQLLLLLLPLPLLMSSCPLSVMPWWKSSGRPSIRPSTVHSLPPVCTVYTYLLRTEYVQYRHPPRSRMWSHVHHPLSLSDQKVIHQIYSSPFSPLWALPP